MKKSNKNMDMKKILIAGYPRSGITYLGYLLSYYFNAPFYDLYDLSISIADGEGVKVKALDVSAFSGHHDRPDQQKEIGAILKTHSIPDNLCVEHESALKAIDYQDTDSIKMIIVREPNDVFVSYFYYNFFRKEYRKNTWKRFIPYKVREFYMMKTRFEEFALQKSEEWVDFYNAWLQHDPYIIWYRKLKRDPLGEIKRICYHENLDYYEDYARNSVDFTKFSNMQKLEEKKYGKSQLPGEKFVRSGKVGESENYFSEKLKLRINDVVYETYEKLNEREKP